MIKMLVALIFVTANFNVFGQTGTPDSSFHLRPHWAIGETKNYHVATTRYRLHGVDTLSNDLTTHDVKVTVLEKTDESYTIEWITNNLSTNSENPMLEKLDFLGKIKKLIFKTDEEGIFQELVNWEELEASMEQIKNSLQTDFNDTPEFAAILRKKMAESFASKETFQSSISKEVAQFLHFHGRHYTPGDIITEHPKVATIIVSVELDTELNIVMDERAKDTAIFSFRSTQEVNSEQMTTASYNSMKTMAKDMGIKPPKQKDISPMRNYTETISLIDQSGWVKSSVQTNVFATEGISNVEKRVMRLQ